VGELGIGPGPSGANGHPLPALGCGNRLRLDGGPRLVVEIECLQEGTCLRIGVGEGAGEKRGHRRDRAHGVGAGRRGSSTLRRKESTGSFFWFQARVST